MRTALFLVIYLIGVLPSIIVTLPVGLLLIVFIDGWGGYVCKPSHLPMVWWKEFTSNKSTPKRRY